MITRRSFIKTTLLAASASSLPSQALVISGAKDSPPPALTSSFADHASIHYIAEAYLKLVPEEADLQVLHHRSDLIHPLHQATEHITDDFERNDVVYIDGWIISRTEARLCVMITLAETQ